MITSVQLAFFIPVLVTVIEFHGHDNIGKIISVIKIFQTLHGDNLHLPLHFHTSFDACGRISRSWQYQTDKLMFFNDFLNIFFVWSLLRIKSFFLFFFFFLFSFLKLCFPVLVASQLSVCCPCHCVN